MTMSDFGSDVVTWGKAVSDFIYNQWNEPWPNAFDYVTLTIGFLSLAAWIWMSGWSRRG
jgi:hypothetical protein